MKKWLFLLCCAFSLLLNAASGKAVPSSEKKILVLASFHLAHDWTAKLTDTIQTDSKNFSPPPQITIVAFDMMRVYESQNSEKELLHYLSVIQKGKFDMIVALDSPIMNLLLENSDKVPAGIPILIVSTNSDFENAIFLNESLYAGSSFLSQMSESTTEISCESTVAMAAPSTPIPKKPL